MRCTNMRHKLYLFIYLKWFIALIIGLSWREKNTQFHADSTLTADKMAEIIPGVKKRKLVC